MISVQGNHLFFEDIFEDAPLFRPLASLPAEQIVALGGVDGIRAALPEADRGRLDPSTWMLRDFGSVAEAAAWKDGLLTTTAAGIIVGGFVSDALGAPHTYPSDEVAQRNLTGSVLDSMLPVPEGWTTPFYVMDAGGVWSFAPHTVAQIQAAGRDGKAHVVAVQQALAELRATIAAATTITEILAIEWES